MKQIIKVDKISQFLKDHKMTNKEFCERCGVSVYILNKILTNDINFGYRAIFKVASFMNVSVSDLINYNYVPLF